MEQVITILNNNRADNSNQQDNPKTEEISKEERIHIAKCMAEIAEEMKVVERKYPDVDLNRLKRKVLRLCQY